MDDPEFFVLEKRGSTFEIEFLLLVPVAFGLLFLIRAYWDWRSVRGLPRAEGTPPDREFWFAVGLGLLLTLACGLWFAIFAYNRWANVKHPPDPLVAKMRMWDFLFSKSPAWQLPQPRFARLFGRPWTPQDGPRRLVGFDVWYKRYPWSEWHNGNPPPYQCEVRLEYIPPREYPQPGDWEPGVLTTISIWYGATWSAHAFARNGVLVAPHSSFTGVRGHVAFGTSNDSLPSEEECAFIEGLASDLAAAIHHATR